MAKRAEKWQVITPISDQELETREKERRALQRVKQSMMDLKTSLREMIFAFDILVPVAIEEDFPLMTNGKELYVSASYVADKASSELKKEILHITLHGLLGHFEEEKHLSDSELAWAAMDLKVEKMLRFYRDADQVTPREYLQLKGAFGEKANRIKREPIGMELYYRGKEDPVFRKKVLKNGERARRDDHHAWRMKSIQVGLLMGIDGQQGSAANKEGYGEEWSAAAKAVGELLRQCGNEVGGNGENGYLESVLEKILEKAARENGFGQGGNGSGTGMEVNEKNGYVKDYRDLLSELKMQGITLGEEDIPDTIFYCYGMNLYGNMPLVEPLEEAEKEQLEMVVVAVDTSGSCVESLPEFLRETRGLLEQLSDAAKVKYVWYMECDSSIGMQELYEEGEIKDALRIRHAFTGGGGTDFRPVFQQIREYEEQGGRVSALLYYSDGFGDFPKEIPDYPCYFIQAQQEHNNPDLPEWVERVWF